MIAFTTSERITLRTIIAILFKAEDKDIPEREVIDVIAKFLSLVISLIVLAFKFSGSVSLPSFGTSLFPMHRNAFSHAYFPNSN
jgi:hypothetical protein